MVTFAPEFKSEHDLLYKTDAPMTALALADSLSGLDGLIIRGMDVLPVLMPGFRLARVEVLIQNVSFGSYKEKFWVRLIFGSEDELEHNIETLRRALKLDHISEATQLLHSPQRLMTGVILASIAFGIWLFWPTNKEPSIHLEDCFIYLGDNFGHSSEDVIQAFTEAVRDKERFKADVSRLIHPSGQFNPGDIVIDGLEMIAISRQETLSVPEAYLPHEKKWRERLLEFPLHQLGSPDSLTATNKPERREALQNQIVIVRSADIDNRKRGWSAVVPALSDRRVKLEIDESIELGSIPIGIEFRADLCIRFGPSRASKPKLYRLTRLAHTDALSTSNSAAVPQPNSITQSSKAPD